MPRYIHPHSLVLWEWLYHATIYPPPLSSSRGEGVIPWHCIFIPHNIWWGGYYIVTLHFHSWQHLVRGWLHRWSQHHIFGSHNIWWGWLYCDHIFSLLTIFGEGVIISWPYIFTPDNIWWGGDYIMTFSLLIIFGKGVIILWLYIFTHDNIWWGGIISWPYIFPPNNVWWGGDHIVTSYFHSWRSPRIWHWRWYFHYPNLTMQWYQGFIIHIHIFTTWNLRVVVITFKHDIAVET